MIAKSILRVAAAFLHVLLPASQREPVLGDLAEEYASRARSGSALPWLFGQVCRSVPAVFCMAVRRDAWLSTIGIAVGAWVAASVFESAAVVATSRLVGDRVVLGAMLGTLLGMLSMACGGYVAALLRPGAAHVMAAVVLIVVIALMLAPENTSPLWYQLTFLLVGPVAPMLGGALAGDHQLRPRR